MVSSTFAGTIRLNGTLLSRTISCCRQWASRDPYLLPSKLLFKCRPPLENEQYIGPLVKLLYDYNGIDFHLFTNLIRCDGWRKLFISEMSLVLQTTTRTCSGRRARTLRSTSFNKIRRWGHGTTRNSICTYTLPILVKLTFALRTVKFVKFQSLFKIYKHGNVL